MLKYFYLIVFSIVVFFVGCDKSGADAVQVCRDLYQNILLKADNLYIPNLSSIKTPEQYLNFLNENYQAIQQTDQKLRACMRDSVDVASEEEKSNWIRAGVRLGNLESKWNRYIENPEVYAPDDINAQFKLEYRVNSDIRTFNEIAGKAVK